MRQIAGRSRRRNLSEMILRSRLDQLAVLDLDVDAAAGADRSQNTLARNRQVTLTDASSGPTNSFVAASRPNVH